MSSARDEYETPHDLFDALWEEVGGFDLDPCCTPAQYTAGRVLGHGTPVPDGLDYRGSICIPPLAAPEAYHIDAALEDRVLIDGLLHPWHGKVYMNPPYSNPRPWVERARDMVRAGHVEFVFGLLPVATDTRWWQENIGGCRIARWGSRPPLSEQAKVHKMVAAEIRFLRGRLSFPPGPTTARFPSAVVVWRA